MKRKATPAPPPPPPHRQPPRAQLRLIHCAVHAPTRSARRTNSHRRSVDLSATKHPFKKKNKLNKRYDRNSVTTNANEVFIDRLLSGSSLRKRLDWSRRESEIKYKKKAPIKSNQKRVFCRRRRPASSLSRLSLFVRRPLLEMRTTKCC